MTAIPAGFLTAGVEFAPADAPLTVDKADTGASGGIATTVSQRIWETAFSQLAVLGQLNVERTAEGGPHVMYRFRTIAGASAGDEDWGKDIDPVAEGAAFGAADAVLSARSLGSYKRGWRTAITNEAETDVYGLAEKLADVGGTGLALDALLQVVNGAGAGGSPAGPTGFRTRLANSSFDSRKVVSAAAPTPAVIDEVFAKVPSAARMSPSCGWVTSDINGQALKGSLRDMGYFDVTDYSYSIGAIGMLLGKPVYAAPGFPAFAAANDVTLLFGALDAIALRFAGPVRIDRFRETTDAWGQDKTEYRFAHRLDCDVVDAECLAFTSGS